MIGYHIQYNYDLMMYPYKYKDITLYLLFQIDLLIFHIMSSDHFVFLKKCYVINLVGSIFFTEWGNAEDTSANILTYYDVILKHRMGPNPKGRKLEIVELILSGEEKNRITINIKRYSYVIDLKSSFLYYRIKDQDFNYLDANDKYDQEYKDDNRSLNQQQLTQTDYDVMEIPEPIENINNEYHIHLAVAVSVGWIDDPSLHDKLKPLADKYEQEKEDGDCAKSFTKEERDLLIQVFNKVIIMYQEDDIWDIASLVMEEVEDLQSLNEQQAMFELDTKYIKENVQQVL